MTDRSLPLRCRHQTVARNHDSLQLRCSVLGLDRYKSTHKHKSRKQISTVLFFFFARTDFKKLAWQDSVHTSRYCEIRQWRRKNITFIKVWKSILASWIGLGIAGHLTIRYYHDKWLTVTIISRYCDSAIINIFLENPIIYITISF